MARLRDLVNVNINRNHIKIQDVEIPVIFTFESFPYIEEAYGKPYHIFEKELNRMLKQKNIKPGKNEFRLMKALVYAMVRSGGTYCTLEELEGAIRPHELPEIFEVALSIFNNQYFQPDDINKIKKSKKN